MNMYIYCMYIYIQKCIFTLYIYNYTYEQNVTGSNEVEPSKCISSSRSPRNPPETVAGGAQQVGRRVWRERHLLGPGLTADSRHCGSAGLLQRGSAAPELWGFAAGKGGLDWCLVPISDDFAGRHVGVCKNPAPIRLVFHDPPWAIFSFHSKKR